MTGRRPFAAVLESSVSSSRYQYAGSLPILHIESLQRRLRSEPAGEVEFGHGLHGQICHRHRLDGWPM